MEASLLNGRYRIQRRLGGGAQGAVFLVTDELSGRSLALKVIDEPAQNEAGARLRAEFRRLARLEHPRLLAVHDLEVVAAPVPGIEADTLFFTSDYLPGDDLGGFARRRPAAAALLTALADAASALEHIHAAGLLHCDLKPENIRVTDPETGRAVLLDLGLSVARGVGGAARGTPAYMDRRALAGAPDVQSDLHALGASFYAALSGAPPFPHRDLGQLVAALERGERAPLSRWRPDLDPGIAALIDRLLDEAERPSSAQVLLELVAQRREALGLPVEEAASLSRARALPRPRLFGRDAEVSRLMGALATLGGEGRPRLVRLVGEPGVGRGAVLELAAIRTQLAAASGGPSIELLRGDESDLLDRLGGDPPAPGNAGALAGDDARAPLRAAADRALAALAERARRRPVALLLDGAAGDGRAVELVRSLAAGDSSLDDVPALVVAAVTPDELRPGDRALDIEVPRLGEDDCRAVIAAMIGREPDPDWAASLAAACAGQPRLVTLAVRAAAERSPGAVERCPIDELVAGDSGDAVARLLGQRFSRLDPTPREVAGVAAILGGEARADAIAEIAGAELEAVFEAAAALAAADLVSLEGDRIRLPTARHREAAEAALPSRRRRELHRRALEVVEAAGGATAEVRARHLLAAGPAREAAEAALAAARALTARSALEPALAMARAALERGQGRVASEAELAVAEIALALGRYDEAVRAAERVARSRDRERRQRAHLALARARRKRGELDGAETALFALVDRFPDNTGARGAYARLLLSRGRIDEAAKVAGPIEPILARQVSDPGDALCLEAAGLARLYGGDIETAGRAFSALARRAESTGDTALRGRAAALRGLAAHHAGDIVGAAALYGEAAEAATEAGEAHAAAVSLINRASADSERGRFAGALAALDRALVQLRRLGRVTELPAALYNRGHALLQLGELEAARRAAEKALELAAELETPQMALYARLLLGDLERRSGRLDRAEIEYERALELAPDADRDALAVALNLAELHAERGEERAVGELDEAMRLASTDEERTRWLLSRARVCLRLGEPATELGGDLDRARRRARESGREDLAWRLAALAARLASAAGDRGRARDLARQARLELEELIADTPESRRAGVRSDPDAVALAGLEDDLEMSRQRPGAAAEPSAADELAALRRLLNLSRRLNSELRLAPLLDQVIDTAIELTGAERGFLLLLAPGQRRELEFAVARNIERERLAGPELEVSRSIAERAARTGEVVLTVDAAFDERFGTAASVAAMQLRSVLAVPLRRRSELIGTIYVDHRFQAGAFDRQAVRLCRELADIAAVALGNARLVEENQRRQRAIDDLNRRLEEELGDREKELAQVRSRLPPAEAVGERLPEIVGRSAPMRAMIELIERAAASELPVVITGESGTGKELVARALHRLGTRSGGAFVAVNCGAVPETLLESELFGHVRGAFTGAERSRRGHFEVADGGTLFLDEIADTGPAMQTKLLRALQEGEIRRLGDEQVRRVDVRVIAATNRELAELVTADEFRQDLYYRLNVLTIRVPPLRARIEDLPALAEHILTRLGDGRAALSTAALRALCAYRWPGNVRELENELARAAALSGGAIDVEHLSDRVRAGGEDAGDEGERGDGSGDSLALREHVEALERRLIGAALEETGGNQSKAARLLGLSRYGLQKKLKRYQMHP